MKFLLIIFGAYCLIIGIMYFFQNRLLFIPSNTMIQHPEAIGIQYDDVWFETEDGVSINGWYFPGNSADSDLVIVLSHGNAGNISHRLEMIQTLLDAGMAVFIYDYRGYGKSKGKPTEKGVYKDITAAVQYLKGEKGYDPKQMIMYGRSLGGPIAAYAAATFKPAGLVIDSTFKNLRTMIQDVYPFVPSFLARYKFPTEDYIRQMGDVPVMVMHSRDDELVKFENAEYLYRIAENPVKFVELNGGHNSNFVESKETFITAWMEYIDYLKP